MKMLGRLKDIFEAFLDIMYPIKCCCCGEITRNGSIICADCFKNLEYINQDKRCKACGREKSSCHCGMYVWRFCELVSVFRYEGYAKRIMLRFKINGKRRSADFFAKEMALCIQSEYKDYSFDEICYVPISRTSYNKRGFNQSKLIAEKLSKIFDIRLNSSLKIKHKRLPQHKSKSREERLINSQYKYVCNSTLTGKTILLIDDISTTGATLDDCTRALLFAGADKVCCATAMITSYDKDKKKIKKEK